MVKVPEPFSQVCATVALLWGTVCAAAHTLRFGTAEIDPGETASLPVLVQTARTIHGFSLAFFYDGTQLHLTTFRINEAYVSPSDVAYTAVRDRPGENYAVVGVLLVWDHPCAQCGFPPTEQGEERILGWLDFETTPGTQPAAYQIQPQNNLGNPKVANTFAVQGGQSVLPELSPGELVVRNHNAVRIRSVTVEPGQSADVIIEVDHKQYLGGLQLSLRYDSTAVGLRPDSPTSEDLCRRSITPCGLPDMAGFIAGRIEQFVLNVDESSQSGLGWATVGLVFDYLPPFDDHMLPPGVGQQVLAARFEVKSSVRAPADIPVELTDELGDPPVVNKVLLPLYGEDGGVTELVSISPELQSGYIHVRRPPRVFRRGFVNEDGRVNIADALAVLGYLFSHASEPACVKAADTNDDGRVNVADAVFLLTYLFTPGTPPLPQPFFDCGLDPTDDPLSCLTSTPGCP